MSSWYGWIPTIAGPEIFDYMCSEFLRSIEFKGGKDWEIKKNGKCTLELKRRIEFMIDDERNLRNLGNYIIKIKLIYANKNDITKYTLKGVTLLDENNKVVFETDKIEICQQTGIIKFSFHMHRNNKLFETLKKEYNDEEIERICANQIFRVVRDIYHAHTHHKHQDVLLEPLKADDSEKAVQGILYKYLTKIADYHKEIKDRADIPFYKYFSMYKYKDAVDLFKLAAGEMVYAMSFCNLCGLVKYSDRFQMALNSLDHLKKRIEAKFFIIPIAILLPSIFAIVMGYFSSHLCTSKILTSKILDILPPNLFIYLQLIIFIIVMLPYSVFLSTAIFYSFNIKIDSSRVITALFIIIILILIICLFLAFT